MKISREDFAEMVAKGYEMNSLTSEDVERLLAVGGITVAPPPILPDVTPGDWYLFSYEQDPSIPSQVRTTIGVITVVLATSQATWVDFTSSRAGVARDLPHENNARVMAGSKKLVELNPKIDSLAVYREAQRHRIAILPGIMCSTTPKFNHFIRLSCGFPWSEALEQGIRTLGDIVHTFKEGQTIRP